MLKSCFIAGMQMASVAAGMILVIGIALWLVGMLPQSDERENPFGRDALNRSIEPVNPWHRPGLFTESSEDCDCD